MSIFYTCLFASSCMISGISFGIFLRGHIQNRALIRRLKQLQNEAAKTGRVDWAFQKGAENAAKIWCHADAVRIDMDVRLAILFAESYGKYLHALQWCSGSDDFSYEGRSREGWEKTVQPLLKTSK